MNVYDATQFKNLPDLRTRTRTRALLDEVAMFGRYYERFKEGSAKSFLPEWGKEDAFNALCRAATNLVDRGLTAAQRQLDDLGDMPRYSHAQMREA